MIVPLHNHSEFSQLDGWSTAAEIAARCQDIGCPCCGLTDHGVVAGHLQFAKELTKVGVKPIFGCEVYQGTKTEGFEKKRDQAHLIALAMTDQGLRNLWALNSCAADDDHFYYVGRVFREEILKYKEGIVFTSACALGLVPKGAMRDDYDDLNWYLDNLGDNFYIELSTYPGDKEFNDRDLDGTPITTRLVNEALVEIGLERGCQFVYGDDGHYAFPEQWSLHDIYLARQTGDTVFTPVDERTMYHPENALCIKDETMVRENLSYLPSSVVDNAIGNAVAIGERASAQLPEIRRHLPTFIPSHCPWVSDVDRENIAEVDDPDVSLFLLLVIDGMHRRYGSDPSGEAWERVSYECETLVRDGIHHYFLMGWDQIAFCDHAGISRGPGRGSSAGCIVAYCLGITDVDPLHYGLIFERFWNSGRTDGFPDIDSDFARSSRQDVINYLKGRWGEEMVCAIGTVGRMKPKKVCENMAKAFGITGEDLGDLKRIIGETPDIEIHGVDQIGWSRKREPGKVIYVEEAVGDEIQKWIGTDEIKEMYIEMCREACSRVHLYGIHPSGVVVSDVPLNNELPAALRGSKDDPDGKRPATQFPMDDVDGRSFVKLDVLGLRTLDTLDHWSAMMKDEGIDIEWSGLDLQDHPEEMWDLIDHGFTAGVFQLETPGGKRLCGKMNIRSLDDLAVIVALNRPGPNVERYIAKRNGDEEITYPHARLEELLSPILAPTYGEFVYQEQVINYFNALGYTLNESDAVRKILGKKKPEALEALHDGTGVWEGRGYIFMAQAARVPEKPAQSVWDGLERFASYSFNKCCHAKTYVTLPDGNRMHISQAYEHKVEEIMSMWPDGEVRPHKVDKIVKLGPKPMLEVKTRAGRVFRGTKEHRLLTTKGYMAIEDMDVGCELIVQPRPCSESQRAARSKTMKALSQRPERKAQDIRAGERMRRWQAEQGYEAQVAHIKRIHANNPQIVENLRAVQCLAHERLKWLHANDAAWRRSFMERTLASVRNSYDTGPGYGHCSIASNGMWCASTPERTMCEWLVENGVEFEMHKVLPSGRICDFYFAGLYWEMDGMDRVSEYFADKYGSDLPYVVVTPEDFKFQVEGRLAKMHVENGDPIASITDIGESVAYDIEMDPDGPLNWIANKVVSHNSHAAAYGIIAFRCLYAKYYGPAQFYASCMRTAENEKRKEMLPLYINEARRQGLEVFPPNIELSESMATVRDSSKIYFGFGDVKGVGVSGDYMVELRNRFDYSTPEVFYDQFEGLNKAHNRLKINRQKLLLKGEDASHIEVPEKSPKQLLGAGKLLNIYKAGAWDALVPTDIGMAERQGLEMELLQVILTDYTKEAFEANWPEVEQHISDWDDIKIRWADKVDSEDPDEVPEALFYTVPGVITGVEEKRGKSSGKKYGIVTIEYESHELSFVAYNSTWKSYRFLMNMRTPGIFTIKHTPPNEFPEVYSYQLVKAFALKP
jgi:DNA polymerase-3 subunit alpha